LELARVGRVSGAIVDHELDPDLEVVRVLRSRSDPRPVLVISATCDPLVISSICGLGASFASMIERRDVLRERALALTEEVLVRKGGLEHLAQRRADAHGLTPGERRLLIAYVRHGRRDVLADVLGVAETTVRTYVRRTCRKLDIVRLSEVNRLLLDDALVLLPTMHWGAGRAVEDCS
jgi:DNA-binding NarL/FixJ family response regulator